MEEKREEQKEMERETFQSRLGFLLLSAGCAIGIGNVWKFPYMVGNNGGGIFVLFYLLFLAIMGVPILSMELAIGRGSKKSTVRAYGELEKKGQKWHIHGYVALIGNYLLMMFYTVVAGWMLYYFYSFLIGKFSGLTGDAVTGKFNEMLSSPSILVITMLIITIAGFLICSVGLQNGVERVTKVMMIVLMVIMIFLAVYSFTMPGAKEGLKFYLVPDMQQIEQVGLFHIITNAMSQAFFTLSLGIGAMLIFGSYLNGGKSLLGEAVSIAALDTFVAITAGLIIFPACFSYNVQKKVTEDFWNREDQANQIRRKDISNLPYITIPLEKFPIGISDDEELTDYENDLKTLASRKILNLSHQSNTDLKLAYGPANLPALSEYDQNYTTLLRNLVAYADCLIKNGFKAEAVPVLEFGISIDSDIRANYTLLAELYKEQGNASKIQELIDKAASLDSMMRSAILEQLHTLQNA